MSRIDEIRARLMAGPLVAVHPRSQNGGADVAHTGPTWSDTFPRRTAIREIGPWRTIGWDESERWADFFATAPDDITWLIDEIERLNNTIAAMGRRNP